MPKLICIHGPMAVGKSTITEMLMKKLPNFSYVDRPNIKRGLKPAGRQNSLIISKQATYFIIKELMKIKKDIIVEEINPTSIKKKLNKYIKKNKYKIYSFYLLCSLNEAIKRDIKRSKKSRKNRVKQIHKEFESINKEGIFINTEKLTANQTLKLILKEIKN